MIELMREINTSLSAASRRQQFGNFESPLIIICRNEPWGGGKPYVEGGANYN